MKGVGIVQSTECNQKIKVNKMKRK